MSLNNLYQLLTPFILIIIIVPTLFIPTISNNSLPIYTTSKISNLNISNSLFYWPLPGYTKISSYFGKRNSPTAGASSFHQGIDIPAPYGSNLVAVFDGIVTFIGFNGSGRLHYTFKK